MLFLNASVYGLDISKTAVTRAIEKFNNKATFYVSDIGKDSVINNFDYLPWFDVIILGDILYHLKDMKEMDYAVKNMNAVLKNNGTVIITEHIMTKKYSSFLADVFKKVSEQRFWVIYDEAPITLEKNKKLSYRMVVYKKEEK